MSDAAAGEVSGGALAHSPALPLPRLARIEAWALRAPITTPVITSFGTMRDRPAVFVRVSDDDGAEGWGEAWCNFPGVGAEHRARLLIDTVAPLALKLAADLAGVGTAAVDALWPALDAKLRVLALQTGEPGPLAQSTAAIDIALWDLAARRRGWPLWRALGGGSGRARVYASGLHPNEALDLAATMRQRGHRAFKMKVGFDPVADARRLHELRTLLGDGATLMVDANQAWAPEVAPGCIEALADAGLAWLEEPIAADHDVATWAALAARSPVPLAAGENLRGHAAFDAMLGAHALAYVQPDIGKWGGLTASRAVAARAAARGAVFCPHWLGGPIGLVASMHLRAALGPAGWVEWDANPNPLHERAWSDWPVVADGAIELDARPGLGWLPQTRDWADLVTWSGSVARA